MSRVGKNPVPLQGSVKAKVSDGTIVVEGSLGSLKKPVDPLVEVSVKDQTVVVGRKGETPLHRARQGLMRGLIANMVRGVTTGFSKELQIIGVGYGAQVKGREVLLNLGFSKPVAFSLEEGVTASVEKQTLVKISGVDKASVGETAARLRKLRPVEPYKGKGIRYSDEIVKKKVGKAAVAGGAKP